MIYTLCQRHDPMTGCVTRKGQAMLQEQTNPEISVKSTTKIYFLLLHFDQVRLAGALLYIVSDPGGWTHQISTHFWRSSNEQEGDALALKRVDPEGTDSISIHSLLAELGLWFPHTSHCGCVVGSKCLCHSTTSPLKIPFFFPIKGL